MLLSVLIIALAIFLLRQRGNARWLGWGLSATILIYVTLTAIEIGLTSITGEGVNGAVFYHMATGLEGGDVSQYYWTIIVAVFALGAVGGGLWFARKWLRPGALQKNRYWDAGIAVLLLAALAVHPVPRASAAYALRFSNVDQQVDGYHQPALNSAGPEAPKNLVILYLESLERTYMNQDRFPGLTPNLTELEKRAVTFTDIGQTAGATFTIGGMVATQCGVPLILAGGANSMRVSQFLSGATCLGDILSEAGYTLSYLGGASTEFAGKGAFYESHGYAEVTGLEQLRPDLQDPAYLAEWGLQDDTLFDLARDRFDRLASADQPFVLTMLTLDTHHPNGHADTNRVCADMDYADGSNPMLNAVMCDDYLAGQFINEILAGPHAKDTVIAIMSDHLAMVNTAADQLRAGPRRNLFMVIDPESDPKVIDRPGTTLDTGPTLMNFLGFDLPLIGLGADLLGDAPTIPEALDIKVENTGALDSFVMGFQSVYTRLWAYPDISNGLYVNLEGNKAQFGHSSFRLPVLLEFDDANAITQAILGDRGAQETLTEILIGLPEGSRYMWIDDCLSLSLMQSETASTSLPELCALTGERGSGAGLRAFGRSEFVDQTQLAAMLASEPTGGGDTEALVRIGQARGDTPLTLVLPALATGDRGVMLQSSAFGAGASLVRRQTTDHLRSGEDWPLGRGINLVGVSADGRAEVLDRLDQCAGDFDASNHSRWRDWISQTRGQFVAHAIVVHDTAYCGSSFEPVAAPLDGLNLPELRASAMREAYVAVLPSSGEVHEFPNRAFPRLRLFLDPMAGDSVPETASSPVVETVAPAPSNEGAFSTPATPVAAAPVPVAPIAPVVAAPDPVTADTITPAEVVTCFAPAPVAPVRPTVVLPLGERTTGAAMSGFIGFTTGWWGEERYGRWSGLREVSFTVLLPEGDTGLALELEVASPTEQTLVLFYSSTNLGSDTVNGSDQFRAEVGSLPRGVPVTLTLTSEGPALTCPAARGASTDARQMGFMLKSIALSQTDAPVVPLETATAPAGEVEVASVCQAAGANTAEQPVQSPLALDRVVSVSEAIAAGSLGFTDGWWTPEDFGVWMGANQAQFQIMLPDSTGPLYLRISTAAFGVDTMGAVLTIGDQELARQNAGAISPLTADVTSLPRGEPLTLTLSAPGVALDCPAAKDGGNDPRALSLMVQFLKLIRGTGAPFTGSIAHGGGRLGRTAISDSFDALRANIDRFNVFEIDFNWTTDGQLVCIHDWEGAFTSRFGADVSAPVDHGDFLKLLAASPDQPRNCDLDGLAGWLRENPGVSIVTDVKEDPVAAQQLIAARHPDLLPQFIPQAYQPEEIAIFRDLGFERVIWTLYRFGNNAGKVIEAAAATNPSAIAMPREMADAGLLEALNNATDVPLYVHTVNDPAVASCLLARGASGIYSDDLSQNEVEVLRTSNANCT